MGSDGLEWDAKHVRNRDRLPNPRVPPRRESQSYNSVLLPPTAPHVHPMFHQKWGLEQGRQAGQNLVTFKMGLVEISIPAVLLPQPPESWGYGHARPHPALFLLQPSLVILVLSRRPGHVWIKHFGGDLRLSEFYRKADTITDILGRVKTS